jgi:2-polyprenyl-3-methyl-5-hydroxy-6-metoxy-1,4-benzoquinol methylase
MRARTTLSWLNTVSGTILVVMQDPSDAERSRTFYDQLGIVEWDRLTRSPSSRVAFEMHKRLLARFVKPGFRVLEIGAGPGRFTIELAQLGATIVTTDISPVQLQLNHHKVAEAGLESNVDSRLVLDVTDLSSVANESFDAVVAFGGPLSYAFEDAEDALGGCLRVTRPGGMVLASVMSLVGSLRFHLAGVVEEMSVFGIETIDSMVRTGEQRHTPHNCRMFRWSDIEGMLGRLPCVLVEAQASNAMSLNAAALLETFEVDPARWATLLSWEEELTHEPGALDGGTHILFAARKSSER